MITLSHKKLRYIETASKPFSSFLFFILFASFTIPSVLDKFALIQLYSTYSVAFFSGFLLPGIHYNLEDVKNFSVLKAVLRLILVCSIGIFALTIAFLFSIIYFGTSSIVLVGVLFFFAFGLSRSLSTIVGVTDLHKKITIFLLISEISKPALLSLFIMYSKITNLEFSNLIFQIHTSHALILLIVGVSSFSSALISFIIIKQLSLSHQLSSNDKQNVLTDHFMSNINTTLSALFSLLPGFIVITWSTKTSFESQSTALQFSNYALLPISLYIERSALELQRKLSPNLNLQSLIQKLFRFFRSHIVLIILFSQLFSFIMYLVASRFDSLLNSTSSFITMSIFSMIIVTYMARNLILILERVKRISILVYLQTTFYILLLLTFILIFRSPSSIQYASSVLVSSILSYALSVSFFVYRLKLK